MNLIFRILLIPVKIVCWVIFCLACMFPSIILSTFFSLICEKEKENKVLIWSFAAGDKIEKIVNNWGCPKKGY